MKFKKSLASFRKIQKCISLDDQKQLTVVFAGGTMRSKAIRELFLKEFEVKPQTISNLQCREFVSTGAAIMAKITNNQNYWLQIQRVVGYELRVSVANNNTLQIVKKNSSLPYKKTYKLQYTNKPSKQFVTMLLEGSHKEIDKNIQRAVIELNINKKHDTDNCELLLTVEINLEGQMMIYIWSTTNKLCRTDCKYHLGVEDMVVEQTLRRELTHVELMEMKHREIKYFRHTAEEQYNSILCDASNSELKQLQNLLSQATNVAQYLIIIKCCQLILDDRHKNIEILHDSNNEYHSKQHMNTCNNRHKRSGNFRCMNNNVYGSQSIGYEPPNKKQKQMRINAAIENSNVKDS